MKHTAENDAPLPLPCRGEEDENGVWHCAVCGRRGDEDCDPDPHWGRKDY